MRPSSETRRAFGVCGQHCGDDLLVFFRLQRAGGVDDAAAGADGAQCGGENRPLAFGLAREVFEAQAVANLRVAAQRSGAAARHVGQHKVEGRLFRERGCVGQAAFDPVAEKGQPLAQLLQSRRAGFAGDDAGLRVALGQDQRLAAGSRAGIEDAFHFFGFGFSPASSATSCEPSS